MGGWGDGWGGWVDDGLMSGRTHDRGIEAKGSAANNKKQGPLMAELRSQSSRAYIRWDFIYTKP